MLSPSDRLGAWIDDLVADLVIAATILELLRGQRGSPLHRTRQVGLAIAEAAERMAAAQAAQQSEALLRAALARAHAPGRREPQT